MLGQLDTCAVALEIGGYIGGYTAFAITGPRERGDRAALLPLQGLQGKRFLGGNL